MQPLSENENPPFLKFRLFPLLAGFIAGGAVALAAAFFLSLISEAFALSTPGAMTVAALAVVAFVLARNRTRRYLCRTRESDNQQ